MDSGFVNLSINGADIANAAMPEALQPPQLLDRSGKTLVYGQYDRMVLSWPIGRDFTALPKPSLHVIRAPFPVSMHGPVYERSSIDRVMRASHRSK